MDQAIRNKLRSVVTQCRRLLEESIAEQLQGKYNIYATGKKDEVRAEKNVPQGHLSDEERQARQDILAHFEHIKALGYKSQGDPGATDPGDHFHAPEPPLCLQDDGGAGRLRGWAEVSGSSQQGAQVPGVPLLRPWKQRQMAKDK